MTSLRAKIRFLGDESNGTVNLQRMDRSMEEAVSTFQSMFEAEQ